MIIQNHFLNLEKTFAEKVTKVNVGSNPVEYTIAYNNFNLFLKRSLGIL
jgi:hypothetical protein